MTRIAAQRCINEHDEAVRRPFRRSFVRSLAPGKRLTAMESAAVDRAVTLTIQAQAALLDPSIAPEIRVRIDNAAARARRDAQAIIDAGRREQPSPTLQQILAAA